MEVKVEKAGIRFKNLDPEYADKITVDISGFHIGRKEKTKVLSIRVPPELYHIIELYSKSHGMTISELIRKAIEKYLNSDE